MENVFEFARGIAGFIFAFSFAVFVHELGHFTFAKLFGVKVDAFAIGFGKKLFGFRRGETEYSINLLPFGGYVKMAGVMSREMEHLMASEVDSKKKSEAEEAARELEAPAPAETMAQGVVNEMEALRAKPYWQKLLIFAAGCINNLITAAVVFFLLMWIGVYVPAPIAPKVAAVVVPGGYDGGLRPGDEVVSVGSKSIADSGDVNEALLDYVNTAGTALSSTIGMQVLRDGTTVTVQFPVDLAAAWPPAGYRVAQIEGRRVANDEALPKVLQRVLESSEINSTVTVGLVAADGASGLPARQEKVLAAVAAGPYWWEAGLRWKEPPYVALPSPNLPAEKAGMKRGDTILEVDGVPVDSSYAAREEIRRRSGRVVPVLIERGGGRTGKPVERLILNIEVRKDPLNAKAGQIGIAFGLPPVKLHRKPLLESAEWGITNTSETALTYLQAMGRLLTSPLQIIRESAGGPVAIGVQFYKATTYGWVWFLNFFATFNIILAVTNLLPIPVMDGGHILFATIEAITRRPLPAKWMLRIYNVFVALLLSLAAVVTVNDLVMNSWRVMGAKAPAAVTAPAAPVAQPAAKQ